MAIFNSYVSHYQRVPISLIQDSFLFLLMVHTMAMDALSRLAPNSCDVLQDSWGGCLSLDEE